jgi:hypothetical protein
MGLFCFFRPNQSAKQSLSGSALFMTITTRKNKILNSIFFIPSFHVQIKKGSCYAWLIFGFIALVYCIIIYVKLDIVSNLLDEADRHRISYEMIVLKAEKLDKI